MIDFTNYNIQVLMIYSVPSLLSLPSVPDKTVTVSVSVLYFVKLLQNKHVSQTNLHSKLH